MAKKVAVLVVNPVNGSGLFQYLETFFENGIPFRTFAVADTTNVKTNSGLRLQTDDVIPHSKAMNTNTTPSYSPAATPCPNSRKTQTNPTTWIC